MRRVLVGIGVVAALGCATRPSRDAALMVPLVDAVEAGVGDPDVQLRVPAADIAEQGGPRPDTDLEIWAR